MIARFFIDRPIFATVPSLVVVILGLVALLRRLTPPAHAGTTANKRS